MPRGRTLPIRDGRAWHRVGRGGYRRAIGHPAAPTEGRWPVTQTSRSWRAPLVAAAIVLVGSSVTYLGAGLVAHQLRNDLIVEVAPLDGEADEAADDLRIRRALASGAATDGSGMGEGG